MKWQTAVFCDFDGTISLKDVGYHFFRHFSGGKVDELIPDFRSGKLSTRDCLLKEAAMSRVPPDEVEEFIDQFEIDPGFPQFVARCRQSSVPVVIASGGFEFYIRQLLKKYDLDHLPLLCNRARLVNERVEIEFPYRDRDCRRCGNCKGERIREFRVENGGKGRVVFVGDGYSDVCAVAEADIVYAKKDLEKYCQLNDIGYRPYSRFTDIESELVRDGYLRG